jgi:hypothetical protein
MLSAVLRSARAIQTSIAIVRVFVRLRELLASHKELSRQMAELERTQKKHATHIRAIYQTLQQLMRSPAVPSHRRIGFVVGPER